MVFAVLLGLHTFLPGGSGHRVTIIIVVMVIVVIVIMIVIILRIVLILIIVIIIYIQSRYEPVTVSRIAESCKQLAVNT